MNVSVCGVSALSLSALNISRLLPTLLRKWTVDLRFDARILAISVMQYGCGKMSRRDRESRKSLINIINFYEILMKVSVHGNRNFSLGT